MKTFFFIVLFCVSAQAESYKLTNNKMVLRLSDKAWIPQDENNTDYVAYLEWRKENTPLPPDPVPSPTKTELDLLKTELDLLKKEVENLKKK